MGKRPVSMMDRMAVTVPPGRSGDVEVSRFTIGEKDIGNMLLAERRCQPGQYTKMKRGRTLWMSDTTAERRDHVPALAQIDRLGGRILIGGLGLGCIVQGALTSDAVEHVDVVEIDEDVIRLVGPHYRQMAQDLDKSIDIHAGDVFDMRWPTGSRWSVCWFDVWPDLCTDNLKEMAYLRRSYARRSDWCECWGRGYLQRRRRQEQREERRWL